MSYPLVKFGDVVRQVKDKVDPQTAGLDRYVAGEHMDTDNLHIRRWGEIGNGYLGPAFHMRFKPRQILYGSRRTYLRKVAVADFEGITANTTYVLEPKDPTVLLPDFLPFVMSAEIFHEHSIKQSKGSVNPYINFSDIEWYEFPLPPVDDQRRIADLLWAADDHLFEVNSLLESLVQLRKSYVVEKFKHILKNGSKIVTVAQAGEVLMGRQRSPQYETGISPRPYLRVANVYDGFVDTTDVKMMDFSNKEYEIFGLKHGDVLLVEGHSSAEVVGRSLVYKNEVPGSCFQNTLLRFRPHTVSSEFAHQYFRYCLYTREFSRVAKQTTIAHLGSTRFAKMKFPLVSKEIDDEITKTISNIEATIAQTEQQISANKNLKSQMFAAMLGNNNGDQ
jgi:type I restriction enzyme, S subunit